jgi:hypothetical protein
MSASNMPGIDAAKRPLDRVGPELGITGLWLCAERSLQRRARQRPFVEPPILGPRLMDESRRDEK